MTTKTIEYNKAEWGPGPWDTEPDYVHWVDEATKLDCLIVRNHMGALCGYVGVPRGHPAFKKFYANVEVDAHGGLTYSDHCQGHICHENPNGPDAIWWLGFDCAHLYDYVPGMKFVRDEMKKKDPGLYERLRKFHAEDTYKDIEYVRAECTRLAEQLAHYTGGSADAASEVLQLPVSDQGGTRGSVSAGGVPGQGHLHGQGGDAVHPEVAPLPDDD